MDLSRKKTGAPSSLKIMVTLITGLAMLLGQGVMMAHGTWESMLDPQLITKAYDGSFAEDDSWEPDVSDDGRFIVFTSDSNDLTPDDEDFDGDDGERDVFRYDRLTGDMEIVSSAATMTVDRGSRDAKISGDGRYVLFYTGFAFVPEDENDGRDFYVKDMDTGEFHFVDFYGDGSAFPDSWYEVELSGNGEFIAFDSYNGDLLDTGKTGVQRNVWGYDLTSDEATLVSAPADPGAYADRGSQECAVSDDGRYVAFFTGNDWDAADENGDQNLYVRDMQTGEMRMVDWYGDGGAMPAHSVWNLEISGDGTMLAFESDYGLIEGDDATPRDVYAYDLVSEEATLVSGPAVDWYGSRDAQLSDDGDTVMFYTGLALAEDDVDDYPDFYVKDLMTGEFTRIPATDPDGIFANEVEDVALSGDGMHIVFGADDGESREVFAEGVGALATAENENIYYLPVVRGTLSDGVSRIEGDDRYETAVDVSFNAFPNGADTVVIATGEDWPDALGGATLAGAVDGPMLLTASNWLNPEVEAELTRLGTRNVYLLGGYDAISPAVETQLEMLLDGYVWRIGGPDRYATSKAVANRAIEVLGMEYDGKAVVTTGMNFPDAVGAAPLGAGLGWPILLVRPTDPSVLLPPTTTSVVILGGEAAVGSAVEDSLIAGLGEMEVERLGGATRYETSAMAAEYGVDYGLMWNGVGITSGTNYPDALSGGVALGLHRTTLLLTPPTTLHPAAAAALTANAEDIEDVTFLGGTAAVDSSVEDEVLAILGL